MAISMSKKTALLSVGYWFSAITLGMLLHPYKSVRDVVRQPHLRVLVWAPIVWGVIFWLMAVGLILIGRLVAEIIGFVYPHLLYKGLEGVFWWAVWFLILWQGLVGYLFFRFKKALS